MNKIILALDIDDLIKAKNLVKQFWPKIRIFKIGLELINTGKAPELINFIHKQGAKVFYDIKLNDIPNTIGKATKVISSLGVWGFTIHASVGRQAIREAIKNKKKSKVFGVTVLTSLCNEESQDIFGAKIDKKVVQFANILLEEGVGGLVCSSKEAIILKSVFGGKKLKIITPGIRPEWAQKNEQERVATPAEAIKAGADFLVIGRPITDPPKNIGSPAKALDLILLECVKEK